MPAIPLRNSANFHDEQYIAAQREIQRILAAITHYNETRQQDQEVFAALQRSFEHQQQLAKEHSNSSVKVKQQLSENEMAYSFNFLEEMKLASAALDELACLIRLELGLEANIDEFRAQTTDLYIQMDSKIQELLARATASR